MGMDFGIGNILAHCDDGIFSFLKAPNFGLYILFLEKRRKK